ncbi:MAG: prepilin-type N-terminal cleavage/methylation domain-containing protein [bacterium]|nr:prepilin-type N-terminal cleavage/methylation domain-containing protein [bacterium]
MTAKNTQQGFTLIELVIVIGILGILMGVVISVLNPALYQKKARDVVRKNHILEIAKAANAYYAEVGSWPDESGLTGGATPYIKTWPNSDPVKAPNTYSIPAGCTGTRFCIQVGQEIYDSMYIRWDSEQGKIEENVAVCTCT